MQRLINPLRIAGLVALALAVSVTACGGGDDGDDKPTSSAAGAAPAASTSYPLLAKIPSLGESYPAGLSRFVDTETGKPYGLAVTVADDGNVVAYLCDGKSLGRAFSGTIEDGAKTATVEAVKGEGTVTLDLSGDEPRAAQVDAGDVAENFALASTDTGGYFREEVEGVTRGWVVSDTLALKGVATDESGGKGKATISGQSLPPLSPQDQQLVGAQENAQAPPETAAFLKGLRCSRLKNNYDTAFGVYDGAPTAGNTNNVNSALARGKQLGCDWANRSGTNFITT
jgi:hypothetical protein